MGYAWEFVGKTATDSTPEYWLRVVEIEPIRLKAIPSFIRHDEAWAPATWLRVLTSSEHSMPKNSTFDSYFLTSRASSNTRPVRQSGEAESSPARALQHQTIAQYSRRNPTILIGHTRTTLAQRIWWCAATLSDVFRISRRPPEVAIGLSRRS